MPTAADPRIDDYIAQSAPFAQPILRHLRALIHQSSPEVEETFKWSHPNFLYRGKILCNFAAFKAHATFGFWHPAMRKLLADDIGKSGDAMGVFGRLTRLEDLPSDKTLLRYLKAALQLSKTDTPKRAQRPTRPPPTPPPDFVAALKKNQAAATTFKKFSPSQRHDFIEWITESKRDDTRQKRLATTIEWLAAGKTRNWKYESC